MTDAATRCIRSFQDLQDRICADLEALDGGGAFREDAWTRPGGGGGRTRILEGALVERGGVNFSAVHGTLSEAAGKALGTGAGQFLATGVSIVLHPRNPWVPIIHMNVRYFELEGGRWWFGGGIDLTPHYLDDALAARFHARLEATCRAHALADYDAYRAHADRYFYLPHRGETRGVGGIFFDRLDAPSFEEVLRFAIGVGDTFVPCYAEQAVAQRHRAYGEREERWQALRRGRYVEFNLVWDRGTRFGLETNGRTESILMSMPPRAEWTYDYVPEPGSAEAHTLAYLRSAYRPDAPAERATP